MKKYFVIFVALGILIYAGNRQDPSKALTAVSSSEQASLQQEPDSSAPVIIAFHTEPSVEVVAPETSLDTDIMYFKNTQTPVHQRLDEIQKLALRKDPQAMKLLMDLGNQNSYLSPAAIKALGNGTGEEVEKYLKDKLSKDNDSTIIVAALDSYIRIAGDEGLPVLRQVLNENKERVDGNESLIRAETIKALGRIGTPAVVSILISELAQANSPSWNLEYGSEIVKILTVLDDPASYSAVHSYAQLIDKTELTDPMVRKYVQEKVKEAQRVGSRQ